MSIRGTFGSVLKLLATGTMSLFLAACYGMMVSWEKITITAHSPEGDGIPDLKVTLLDGSDELVSDTTNANGAVTFADISSFVGVEAKIQDVDGTENGGQFKDAEITLDKHETYDVTLTEE